MCIRWTRNDRYATCKQTKKEGFWVRSVDIKFPEFSESTANDVLIADLRNISEVSKALYAPNQTSIFDKVGSFDEVYMLAAQMGALCMYLQEIMMLILYTIQL